MTPDEDLVREFLDKTNVIAVVGVSSNPEKYGHKIFFDMLSAGYKTYPIHRDGGEVEGHVRYRDLQSLPERPDVVDCVVPPRVTEQIVKDCKELGIDKVWMQPGTQSETAIEFCRENGIKVLHDMCIMVARRTTKGR